VNNPGSSCLSPKSASIRYGSDPGHPYRAVIPKKVKVIIVVKAPGDPGFDEGLAHFLGFSILDTILSRTENESPYPGLTDGGLIP
jgi:hypothetical protein